MCVIIYITYNFLPSFLIVLTMMIADKDNDTVAVAVAEAGTGAQARDK